jgi:hypothetical protein
MSCMTPIDPASKRRRFIKHLKRGEYSYTRIETFGDRSRPETLPETLIQAAFDPDLPGRDRCVAISERADEA